MARCCFWPPLLPLLFVPCQLGPGQSSGSCGQGCPWEPWGAVGCGEGFWVPPAGRKAQGTKKEGRSGAGGTEKCRAGVGRRKQGEDSVWPRNFFLDFYNVGPQKPRPLPSIRPAEAHTAAWPDVSSAAFSFQKEYTLSEWLVLLQQPHKNRPVESINTIILPSL